ncbi:hypothetical protein [Kitasatospora herbaricolor]|uniref:Uncharacterized protein n=1 Tax=Kitasatospora herbaricolor TaxID=68217 RepID=A0ABZ1W1Z6_9ACTN|nr:hypothetical protein [Kitasatospora herbaricolor]
MQQGHHRTNTERAGHGADAPADDEHGQAHRGGTGALRIQVAPVAEPGTGRGVGDGVGSGQVFRVVHRLVQPAGVTTG